MFGFGHKVYSISEHLSGMKISRRQLNKSEAQMIVVGR